MGTVTEVHNYRNTGMHYMLGPGWREYFKHVVVLARKPTFFTGGAPFRLYNEVDDSLSYEKVTELKAGFVYAGVNSHIKYSKYVLLNGAISGQHARPVGKSWLDWQRRSLLWRPYLLRSSRMRDTIDRRYF
jgi:hypothetical protein